MKRIDVVSPARRCCKTGREFKPGDTFYAALVLTEEGLQRLDFAPEAWTGPPENAVGFWRGRIPQQRQQRRRQIDDNAVMERFLALEQDESPSARVLRYVLVLHLMRRRLVRLVRIESRGGEDYIRVRSTKDSGREWIVWCPALTEEEINDLEHRLPEILAGEGLDSQGDTADQGIAA